MPDVFALIAAERRRTADLLDRLTPEQWAGPSLCEGWTTREVAAHLVMPFCVSTPQFIVRMIRNRFSLDRVSNQFATQETRSNAELAALLRANAEHRFTPPGLGPEAPLTDITVHTLDICRPLGIDHRVAPEVSGVILDFIVAPKSTRGFISEGLLDGLRISAQMNVAMTATRHQPTIIMKSR